jgi:class 3 adenylate cyclase/DNA-binding response OmpR family regulator
MSGEEKRILVLEDSDIFADMLMEFLASSGYAVERAINGFEGIKRVYNFMPHLIITDVEMPLFKGYQVTRLLKSRKNTRNIPVVMFTSLGETKDKFWGSQAGADAYIEKSPDNFRPLSDVIAAIFSEEHDIDFAALEREGRRINDNAIIEMVSNLLDNKLFQSTVIGMLTELSDKAYSMEMIVRGIFDLLHNVCETEIVSIMIRGTEGTLYVYTANFAGLSPASVKDFSGISVSDFNSLFPDFHLETKHEEDFFPAGDNEKKIASYVTLPLVIAREKFASVHIANSIKEYFSPNILDNINTFLISAAPIIANALSMHELAELQKKTRTAFARYVPADAMDEIIKSSKKAIQSENRNVVVLFSDIRNFTGISEHSSAQVVVAFLNAFFAKMGSEIISEGGHIDKFIGDAIMAVFGAFHTSGSAPASAIRAAVKMLAALPLMDTKGIGLAEGSLNIGIGINCGECVLGNIGFQNKMDYTIIGDHVNLASRLEGVTKAYRHPLIVSEYMYNATKDHFLFRKVDSVRVKGKDDPVGIYAIYTGFEGSGGNVLRSGEVLDLPTVPSLLINRDMLVNYNKGLRLFDMREWKPAQEYFEKAVEIKNDDYLSRIYLERAVEFAQTPPPDNWDGSITLTEK